MRKTNYYLKSYNAYTDWKAPVQTQEQKDAWEKFEKEYKKRCEEYYKQLDEQKNK